MLSGLASLLISPKNAYLHTLIIPEYQYRSEACERAFGKTGRMNPIATRIWRGNYSFSPFDVKTTKLEFDHSRRAAEESAITASGVSKASIKTSNVSAAWARETTNSGRASRDQGREALVNGVLQGRRQGEPTGASRLSRKLMWQAVAAAASHLVSYPALREVTDSSSFQILKRSELLRDRMVVKHEVTQEALKGWEINTVEDFEFHPQEVITPKLGADGMRQSQLDSPNEKGAPPDPMPPAEGTELGI